MNTRRGNVTTKKIVIGLGLAALIVILGLKVIFVAGPTKKAGSKTRRRRKRLVKRGIRGKPKKRRRKRAR